MSDWCTIECSPIIFTKLIEEYGVQGVEVEDVFDLSQGNVELLNQGEVYGFIFLFKYDHKIPLLGNQIQEVPGLIFAKQVINNACATQAILAVILNQQNLELSERLQQFKEICWELDPQSIGESIGQTDLFKDVHNSFSKKEPFISERNNNTEGGEAYHFVSFIYHNQAIYEIDGLKSGPILHKQNVQKNNWVENAVEIIQQKMNQYSNSETGFHLMVLKESREIILQKRIQTQKLSEGELSIIQNELLSLKDLKYQNELEIQRKRHDYFPFIFKVLEIMGKNKMLSKLAQ